MIITPIIPVIKAGILEKYCFIHMNFDVFLDDEVFFSSEVVEDVECSIVLSKKTR